MKAFLITIFLVVGVVSLGTIWNAQKTQENAPIAEVKDVEGSGTPSIGGKFTLVDQNGNTRHDSDFRGQFMLVYFGYSYCPDICPTGLSNMTQAMNLIGGKSRFVQPIFITIDPSRDTVEQMELYMQNFHPKMIALTGTDEQVQKAVKAYRVYAAKSEIDSGTTEYLMDHSSIVYLMDRQGHMVAHFNHETDPKKIADGILKAIG
ncbi:MAG: SCO family protein [Alphaproteobacteria bacterium]